MGKLTVFTSLTLDGFMQAGRPDEDTRGGFRDPSFSAPGGGSSRRHPDR
jgi:hypothetical protein